MRTPGNYQNYVHGCPDSLMWEWTHHCSESPRGIQAPRRTDFLPSVLISPKHGLQEAYSRLRLLRRPALSDIYGVPPGSRRTCIPSPIERAGSTPRQASGGAAEVGVDTRWHRPGAWSWLCLNPSPACPSELRQHPG